MWKGKEWYRDNGRKIKIERMNEVQKVLVCLNRRKGDTKEKKREYKNSSQCSFKLGKKKIMTYGKVVSLWWKDMTFQNWYYNRSSYYMQKDKNK